MVEVRGWTGGARRELARKALVQFEQPT